MFILGHQGWFNKYYFFDQLVRNVNFGIQLKPSFSPLEWLYLRELIFSLHSIITN